MGRPDQQKYSRRLLQARVHTDPQTFLEDIIHDRVKSAYPDPWIGPNIADEGLIRQYRQACRDAMDQCDRSSCDECHSFYSSEREYIESELGMLHFPPDSTDVPNHLIQRVENASFTWDNTPWELIEDLMELPMQDLRALSAYVLVHNYKTPRRKVDLLNAVRYVRGDPCVSIENVVEILPFEESIQRISVDDDATVGCGVPKPETASELRKLCFNTNVAVIAATLAYISQITNVRIEEGSDYGSANGFGYINLQSKTDKYRTNTIAHELCHIMQYTTGLSTTRVAWSGVDSDKLFNITFSHPVKEEWSETIDHIWNELAAEEIEPIRSYQLKKPCEVLTVAYEAYVEDKEYVRENQPRAYELIEEMLQFKSPDGSSTDVS